LAIGHLPLQLIDRFLTGRNRKIVIEYAGISVCRIRIGQISRFNPLGALYIDFTNIRLGHCFSGHADGQYPSFEGCLYTSLIGIFGQ
jgi:hypothetical protein